MGFVSREKLRLLLGGSSGTSGRAGGSGARQGTGVRGAMRPTARGAAAVGTPIAEQARLRQRRSDIGLGDIVAGEEDVMVNRVNHEAVLEHAGGALQRDDLVVNM